MAKKIKFDDVVQMERLFEQLSAEESDTGAGQFREWEVLHEIDRQQHRRDYDKSSERLAERQKQRAEALRVREYLVAHPEVETELLAKVKK